MLTNGQIEEVLVNQGFTLSLPNKPKKYKVLPFRAIHFNYPIYIKSSNRLPLVIHSDFLNLSNTLMSLEGVKSNPSQMTYFNSNMKGFDTVLNKGKKPERYGLHFGFETVESLKIFLNTLNSDNKANSTETFPYNSDKETDGLGLVTTRIGHQALKEALHKYWNGCSVTGYQNRALLIASHIVPWSENKNSRLDPFNGLLLTPNLDALFDKGLISFNEHGEILISRELDPRIDYEVLGLNHSLKLRKIEHQHLPYLKWHKENKFKT